MSQLGTTLTKGRVELDRFGLRALHHPSERWPAVLLLKIEYRRLRCIELGHAYIPRLEESEWPRATFFIYSDDGFVFV